MIVAEKKSLENLMEDKEGEDLMEDEDDIAMNVDADFSVQLAAMFEPCRSSRIPPIKTKPSHGLVTLPKVTKSKGKATPRKDLFHVSVQIF